MWAHGRGRPTGSGLKASWRGGVIWQASSPKFARLNNVPGVWDLDIDEGGNIHLKVWGMELANKPAKGFPTQGPDALPLFEGQPKGVDLG